MFNSELEMWTLNVSHKTECDQTNSSQNVFAKVQSLLFSVKGCDQVCVHRNKHWEFIHQLASDAGVNTLMLKAYIISDYILFYKQKTFYTSMLMFLVRQHSLLQHPFLLFRLCEK